MVSGTSQHACEIISDYMPLFSKLQPLGLEFVYENIGVWSKSKGEIRLLKGENNALLCQMDRIPIALAEAAFSI